MRREKRGGKREKGVGIRCIKVGIRGSKGLLDNMITLNDYF